MASWQASMFRGEGKVVLQCCTTEFLAVLSRKPYRNSFMKSLCPSMLPVSFLLDFIIFFCKLSVTYTSDLYSGYDIGCERDGLLNLR